MVSFVEGKERDGVDKDGFGDDVSFFGFEEFVDGFGVFGKGEGLVVLEGRFDVVVVGVKLFDYFEGGNIDIVFLVVMIYGEVFIERGEFLFGVVFGNGLLWERWVSKKSLRVID